MRSRPLAAVPVAAAALALLAGCTFSVGQNTSPKVPASEIADLAADQLEEQTGLRPTIDCGQDDLPVKVNTTVTCLLVDPDSGLEFDTVITFTRVERDVREIDVQVADVANNAPVPTAQPGETVPIATIEALAVTALSRVLDYVPSVSCEGDAVEPSVGTTVDCAYDSPDGPVDAVVTITEYDSTTGRYAIRVD